MNPNLQAAQNDFDAKDAQIAQLVNGLDLTIEQLGVLQADRLVGGISIVPNLQNLQGWVQPGNTGNSGGGSAKPHGTWTFSPQADGSQLVTVKPAGAYDNFYFYIPVNITKSPMLCCQHIEFVLTPDDLVNAQALEFEMQYADGAFVHNMAWQLNLASNTWRYFHFTGVAGTGAWIDSGIPFVPGQIVVDAIFEIRPTSTIHRSLVVNGVEKFVGVEQPAVARTGNYFHAAFQLDTKKTAVPYSASVKTGVSLL